MSPYRWCSECDGEGIVACRCESKRKDGMRVPRACRRCEGTGDIPCPKCKSTGEELVKATEIPSSADEAVRAREFQNTPGEPLFDVSNIDPNAFYVDPETGEFSPLPPYGGE